MTRRCDTTEIEELEQKIEILEEAGAVKEVAKYKADLAKLTGTTNKVEEVKRPMEQEATEGVFDTGLTPDEYDGASTGISKRPPVGDYEAEMQMPEDYSPKAFKFPFIITESGAWEGFSGDAFYPIKESWKGEDGRVFSPIKNLATACGVEPKTVKGKVTFALADFAGKTFIATYGEEPFKFERDGRTFEGTQSKIKRAKPLSEKVETLT